MKIIWHSNAPWAPTGYGQQTALFAPHIARHHDLYLSANYGLEAAPIVWEGIPVFPGLGQDHGNATLPGHIGGVFDTPREGLLWTLYDAQVFDPQMFAQLNVACWTPVDMNPPPPALMSLFRESQAIPVAMSRYGENELAEFSPLFVPHAVNTEVYKPSPNIREQMGVPEDAFLVGMVAANKGHSPSRKAFQQAFQAFRELRQKHDDAYLYLHTTMSPEFAGGEDIPALLASLEIPEDVVKYPSQYSMIFAPIPNDTMARIYSSLDVLLNPSMGEGFGVPVLEAQACGTPTICTDYTAMSEVGCGWKVGGRPFWTAQASWMAVPDVGEIYEALEASYAGSDAMRDEAIAHAAKYDIKRVLKDFMLPALSEIEERIGELAPVKVAA